MAGCHSLHVADDECVCCCVSVANVVITSFMLSFVCHDCLHRDLCQAVLRSDFWLAMEKRQSLHRITEEMLIDYIDNFYVGVYIEGLVQGNVLATVRLICDS